MVKDKKNDATIVRGSQNIFADLGYADADTHLLKARLVSRLHDVISERGLTQTEAAKKIGISQPDVSRLLNGHFRDVSVERLMRLLTKLGCAVEIVIRNQGRRATQKETISLSL